MESLLPSLENLAVFYTVGSSLLLMAGLSGIALYRRVRQQPPGHTFAWLKALALLPLWVLGLFWAVLAAYLGVVVGATAGSWLYPLLGLLLLPVFALLTWGLSFWVRSRFLADAAVLLLVPACVLAVYTTQMLWICEPLARSGLGRAQFCTARLYEAGEGGAIRDQGTAREWYRLAAEQGVAEAAYQVGRFSPGREQRIAWYARAADQGHAEAAYQLYRLLEPTDPTAALSRLRSAAGRQHAGAQFLLGQLHRTGAGGTDKDLRRTRELWSRAAKAGDMSAMRALAVAYARGGVLFDHAPALSLHWEQEARKLAASRPPTAVGEQALALNWERELDEVRARHNLADSGDAAALLAIGREILAEADAASGLLDKALGWLERAAVTGSVEAQYLLASRCLGVAPGQEASCAQAQRWLIAAADAGHEQALRKVIAGFKKPAYGLPRDLQRSRAYSEALFNLLDARGTPANHSDGLAASWEYVDTLKQLEKETRGHLPADELQERSDAGDPAAQYQLAREWLGSRFADAVALMSLSAHAGYPQAQYEMARRYRDGKRTPEEERQAIAWLTAAAASGHRGAMVDLGVVYLQGIARIGLERDPYRAKALLAQALEDRDHVVYAQDTGDGRSWRYTVTQVHRWLAQIPDSLAPEDPGVLEEDAQVRRAVEP